MYRRRVDQLLSEYGASHKNPINKAIHWIMVPAIFWTVVAVLSSLPFPQEIHRSLKLLPFELDWSIVVLSLATMYYIRLSRQLAMGMFIWSAFCVYLCRSWPVYSSYPLLPSAIVIFVFAWIGQFLGHSIEGKRPSFFKDLQFLLIGPAWIMHFIFQLFKISY